MSIFLEDDESGEKSVSVLLSGEESEIVFIDHPSSEISVSAITPLTVIVCDYQFIFHSVSIHNSHPSSPKIASPATIHTATASYTRRPIETVLPLPNE